MFCAGVDLGADTAFIAFLIGFVAKVHFRQIGCCKVINSSKYYSLPQPTFFYRLCFSVFNDRCDFLDSLSGNVKTLLLVLYCAGAPPGNVVGRHFNIKTGIEHDTFLFLNTLEL